MLPLILFARLIQIGVEEFTRNIGNARDRAAHGRAIDVHIEHAHENRHPRHRLITKAQWPGKLWRGQHLFDQGDEAIGGGNDEAIILRRGARGIAEECERPSGNGSHGPSQRLPRHEGEKDGDGPCDHPEFAAFGMDGRESPFCDARPSVGQFLFFHSGAI